MKIHWNDLTLEEWEEAFCAVPRSNLLQSWPYAQMMRAVKQMSTRFGRLADGGETLAIFQVHEVKLMPLYHVVILDRGPLWLVPNVTREHWQAFVDQLTVEFPKRFGRRRRFMPEMEISPEGESILSAADFSVRAAGYQSIWIDLSTDEEARRTQLKQNWRNALNQAGRRDTVVEARSDVLTFNWLMKCYDQDRKSKAYQGPTVGVLTSLYRFCKPRGEVMILTANRSHRPIAGILIFGHGQSATYQIGWTDDEGRDARAHQLLLWNAIAKLKDEGRVWLDLGGINPEQAPGVTQFKRGLNGEEFQLAGVYG